MTFPAIPLAADNRVLTTFQANTTSPRTFPNLSSLTKNSGDLLIAIIAVYQSTTVPCFSSWGGSFTEFVDSGTASTISIGAAYKWSTGSETGTFTVAQATTITGHAAMILMSIPGAHASTPPEGGSYASGTGAANPASFDPSGWAAEDTLWIAVGANGETATGGTWTGLASSPTNFGSDVLTTQSGDAVGTMQAGVGFFQQNASAQDAGAWTGDTSNARDAAVVIAVRPAPDPERAAAFKQINIYPQAIQQGSLW